MSLIFYMESLSMEFDSTYMYIHTVGCIGQIRKKEVRNIIGNFEDIL
jgi:hypothetical protein